MRCVNCNVKSVILRKTLSFYAGFCLFVVALFAAVLLIGFARSTLTVGLIIMCVTSQFVCQPTQHAHAHRHAQQCL